MRMTARLSRLLDDDPGTIDRTEETPALRKHCDDVLKRKWPNDTHRIKTRNSPRSAYVRDFQQLSQSRKVNVQRNAIQRLDLACTFKGLTVIDLSEEDMLPAQNEVEHAFDIPSGEPSPTTSEEDENVPELISIDEEQPIPTPIEEDIQEIEDEIWVPPLEQLPTHRRKRRYTPFAIERQILHKQNCQAFEEHIGLGHIGEQ